ncbi:Uncharacterised protein [Corynebacterium jeikeium]|nr:Uncharacterised protein [Corynebacterium jeikeium]
MSASCSLGPVPQATYHARRYPTVIRVLAYTGIRWAEMTLDTYADLFDSDLDRVGTEIDSLIRKNAA